MRRWEMRPLEEVRALLFVMNARAIDEALDSYRRLNVDLCWATGFTVSELVPVHRDVVHSTDYDVILNISDDCVVTQEALDAVLALFAAGYPAATGWCRLNADSELVNLCHEPLRGNIPRLRNYSFYRRDEVVNWPDEIVPTHFMGMSLTGLRRELWREFPYDCYRHRYKRGSSSDYNLCVRLRNAGMPMVAARSGEVKHLKKNTRRGRSFGTFQPFIIGEVEPSVTIDRAADRMGKAAG